MTESFAFLLEHLLLDSLWLEEHLPMEDLQAFIRFINTMELFLIRRYCAKLIYELRLHSREQIDDRMRDYTALLSTAVKVEVSPHLYLAEVDDGFYCADYLRAWIFQAQLRAYLREALGLRWFDTAEAGRALQELWTLGQKYNVEELAGRLGYPGLDPVPLIEELTGILS